MIGFLLIIGFLIGFIKLSIDHNYPLVLAGGYTALATIVMAMFGNEISAVLVFAILTLSVSWLGFWLLQRFEESGVWWIIAAVFPFLILILMRAS